MQNLSIDYSTDPNGRILSMTYTETGGYAGELFAVYDNFGNMTDLRDNSGNSAKAVLVDPNNGAIELQKDLNNLMAENTWLADYDRVKADLDACKARCCSTNPSINTPS